MRRRPGSLTDQDHAVWATYAQAVRPLAGRARPPPPPAPTPAPSPVVEKPAAAPPPLRPAKLPNIITGLQPPGLDRASWARFRGGKMAPARTLDLHGKTVQAAYRALENFLHGAHADRIRCVEIITGRGSGEAGGAIRRELPHWLSLPAIRPLILAAAHPHARNEGATRVLLRRRRT